jgi:hypothetical protein
MLIAPGTATIGRFDAGMSRYIGLLLAFLTFRNFPIFSFPDLMD